MNGGVMDASVRRTPAGYTDPGTDEVVSKARPGRRSIWVDDEQVHDNYLSNRDRSLDDQRAELERIQREALEHSLALGNHYKSFVSTALAERLASVRIDGETAQIALRDGGRIMDEGPRMRVGSGSDSEIGAAIELMRAKGWKALAIGGDDQFVWRSTIAALQDGRIPADKIAAGNPDQAHIVEDAKKRFAAAQRRTASVAPDDAAAMVKRLVRPVELPSIRAWKGSQAAAVATPAPDAPVRRRMSV